MSMRGRRLYRSRTDNMLTGVSGGLAEYFDVDPALVRLMWILTGIFSGGLILLVYVAMWLVVPIEPEPLAQARQRAVTAATAWAATAAETESLGEMGEAVEGETTINGEPVERPVMEYEPVDPYVEPDHQSRRIWAGIILVSLGFIFLGNNFGLLQWFNWKLFWPLVLVGVGAWLLMRRR
jgi:phage shock protein C